MKFGNSTAAKRKIKFKGTPSLLAKFFPDSKAVAGPRSRHVFRIEFANSKAKCLEDDLLSMSYLMIINEINSNGHSTKVDNLHFHLASHWEKNKQVPLGKRLIYVYNRGC